MAKPLTSIVGEVAPSGATVAPPARSSVRVEQLKRFQNSGRLFSIRLRSPGEMKGASSHVRKLTAGIFKQAKTGTVKIVTNRDYDPLSRRNVVKDPYEFKAGEVNRVPTQVALRLLDSDPYRYAFVEVDDPTAPVPSSADLEGAPKPGQVSQIRQLQAELAEERKARGEIFAELSAMRELVEQATKPKQNEKPAKAPKPKRAKGDN